MRQRAWLFAAIALLAAAAWLMSRGDKLHEDRAPRVDFPRYVRFPEQQRINRRRTLPVPAAQPEDPIERDRWSRQGFTGAVPLLQRPVAEPAAARR